MCCLYGLDTVKGKRRRSRGRERRREREKVSIAKLGSQFISLGPTDFAISPAIRKQMRMVKICRR